MMRHVRRRIGMALDRRFRGVNERVESVGGRVDALAAAMARLEQDRQSTADAIARLEQTIAADRGTTSDMLRWLVQDHAANRERLRIARADPSYSAAFDDPQPLVSIVIPTRDNTRLLLDRSLPSVLGQSYERLEVIVAGDATAAEVGEAVAALGDPRLRFVRLPERVRDPDPFREWLAGSVAVRNAGRDLMRGAWHVDFDDDDALRPRAIEHGLAFAREHRLEVAYGPFAQHLDDQPPETVAGYPPTYGRFATQGALVHGGLRFFERTEAAAEFGVANDWFRVEAMLRAGVRFGMHDEVVCDYYPSLRGLRALERRAAAEQGG